MTRCCIFFPLFPASQSADFIAVRQATMREVKVALDAADISFAVAPPVDVKR